MHNFEHAYYPPPGLSPSTQGVKGWSQLSDLLCQYFFDPAPNECFSARLSPQNQRVMARNQAKLLRAPACPR